MISKSVSYILIAAFLVGSSVSAATSNAAKNTDWSSEDKPAAKAETKPENKEEFQREMESDLDEVKRQIGVLEEDLKKASGKARVELNRQLDNLEKNRVEISRKLDEASKTSGRAWSKMRVGLERAMKELKMAYGEAEKEFKATSKDQKSADEAKKE